MSNLKGVTITWLGHATVLIETAKGTRILIDPFIKGNPKFPQEFKMPDGIELMLVTHGHSDHMADAVTVAQRSGSMVLANHEIVRWLSAKGVGNAAGMNFGGSFKFHDVTATMVEAKHSSGIEDGGALIYAGNPGGFVMTIDDGPILYHAGDTCAFSDMKLIRELWAPELAMLPIGDHYTMGPREAALAVEFLGVKTVLPIHFGTFPLLTGTPEALEKALAVRNLKDVEVIKTAPGRPVK